MEKPFKIGIWHYETGNFADGGAFSYADKIQTLLAGHTFSEEFEFVLVGFNLPKSSNLAQISLIPFNQIILLRLLVSFFLRIPFFGKKVSQDIQKKHQKKLIQQLKDAQVELIYYIQPGVTFLDFPHISTIWDNGHLSSYAFPEVAMHGRLESRLSNIKIDLNRAILICAESSAGKKELQDFYGISPNKVEIIPLPPSNVVSPEISAEKIDALSDQEFFLYPAKYWPHKNHYNLLKGFAIFNKKYPDVKLVFTGFHQDNQAYIDQCIADEGLQQAVVQLGVVSLGKLKWLYQNAKALVMATLLGPTNMPLMEAYYLNCPVICSDLAGHREQLGTYASYFNGLDKVDIANKLEASYLSKAEHPIADPQVKGSRNFSSHGFYI
jgi:glycosyltransferase involved in cell wall biosynthesis